MNLDVAFCFESLAAYSLVTSLEPMKFAKISSFNHKAVFRCHEHGVECHSVVFRIVSLCAFEPRIVMFSWCFLYNKMDR